MILEFRCGSNNEKVEFSILFLENFHQMKCDNFLHYKDGKLICIINGEER